MKKLLALVLTLLLVVTCFAGCAKKKDEPKKLLVATNAEFEPFESLTADGEFVGFDIDLMNAIAEKMGYEVQYENMEFDGVIAAVANGTTDLAISGLTINAKRAKSVNFSNPYYDGAAQILIVGKDDNYYTGTDKATLKVLKTGTSRKLKMLTLRFTKT